MFDRVSLRAKLIAAFMMVGGFVAVVGGLGIYYLNSVDAQFSHVVDISVPNQDTLQEMDAIVRGVYRRVSQLGIHELKSEWPKLRSEITEYTAKFDDLDKSYRKIPFLPGEGEAYEPFMKEWSEFSQDARDLSKLSEDFTEENEKKFFAKYIDEVMPAYAKLENARKGIMNFQSDEQKKWIASANSTSDTARPVFMMISAIGVILSLVTGLFVSLALGRQLGGIIGRVEAGSQKVASASSQIAAASTELSESATEQASAIQETAASIDEVSAMIRKNSENAAQSQKSSAESRQATERGRNAVNEMLSSIRDISESNTQIMTQVEHSNQELAEIVKVISEIGNKTKVINDIVFQTKLLSFNASVEAARAGEHGKGFAVVAEEVGNLAAMSGNAAKEISGLLENSIKKVDDIVASTKERVDRLIQEGRSKVEAGSETARRCGEVLDEISRKVSEVDAMVAEIATASREQSQGVEEITKAMGQLDQVTAQNSSVAQQSSSAAEELNAQSAELKGMVDTLNRLLHGAGQGAAPNAAPVAKAKKPAAKAEEKTLSNVTKVDFTPKPKAQPAPAPKAEHHAPAKKVANGGVPSKADPRFEDV